MGNLSVTIALVAVLSVPAGAAAGEKAVREPEGCQVFNPVQPTCKYKATHESASPVTGFSGVGSWVAKIKKGKKVTTVKSPSTGEPHAEEVTIPSGAVVTLKALSPGSAAIAGHVD